MRLAPSTRVHSVLCLAVLAVITAACAHPGGEPPGSPILRVTVAEPFTVTCEEVLCEGVTTILVENIGDAPTTSGVDLSVSESHFLTDDIAGCVIGITTIPDGDACTFGLRFSALDLPPATGTVTATTPGAAQASDDFNVTLID